jgi:hypothetical protein
VQLKGNITFSIVDKRNTIDKIEARVSVAKLVEESGIAE